METTLTKRRSLPQELVGLTPTKLLSLDEMYRFAQVCHQSGLFEDVTDAAQAFAKIARGQELGIQPMASMQAFDIIRKRLYVKPWIIAALINACGYGAYRVLEQSAQCCTLQFRRKQPGLGWEDCPPVSYTLDEAKAHGLVERSPHWKASPAQMLYQRCMGRGGAMFFPELLGGLQTTTEPEPVSPEQHQANVIALYGEERGQSTPDKAPGEPVVPRSAGDASIRTPPLPHDEPGGVQGSMWRETLEAHQTDARLPEALRQEVQTALAQLPSESRGLALAGAVLDCLAAAEEDMP